MNHECSEELADIRFSQGDLRRQLEKLDGRIERLQGKLTQQRATSLPRVPEIPPPVEPKPSLLYIPPVLPPLVPEPVVSAPSVPRTSEKTEKVEGTAEQESQWEFQLGKVWLVRIGIVILVTGLVFLGNFAWNEFVVKLNAVGKLGLIYMAGALLAGLGWALRKSQASVATYGKVLIGGGVATIYYATYAAHFVTALRVIESPLLGGLLLAGLAGAILWMAERMRSQVVAVIAVLLGFYTGAMNPIAGFSLFSNLVLSVLAVMLLLRHRWVSVSYVSLIGSFVAYWFWRFQDTGSVFLLGNGGEGFEAAVLFPFCYWMVFTVAVFLARIENFYGWGRAVFATLNNGAFFACAIPAMALYHPENVWAFTLIYGTVLLVLAWLAARTTAEDGAFDGAYLTQGLALFSLGLLFKFSGYQLAIMLAMQGLALMRFSRLRHEVILLIFSGFASVGAAVLAMVTISEGADHAALTGSVVALVLMASAWLYQYQHGLLGAGTIQPISALYVTLALLAGIPSIWHAAPGQEAIYLFAVVALVMTFSFYALRMAELIVAGQILAFVAAALWMLRELAAGPVSWGPTLVLVALVLVMLHWWQLAASVGEVARTVMMGVYALVLVAVVYIAQAMRVSGVDSLWVLSFSALAILAYSTVFRCWPLAAASQILALAGFVSLFIAVPDLSAWTVCGVGAVFAAQMLVSRFWQGGVPSEAGGVITHYAVIWRAALAVLACRALEAYLPEDWKFLVMMALAFGSFTVALVTTRLEPAGHAIFWLFVGLYHFVDGNIILDQIDGTDIFGLLLILLAQQLGKWMPERVSWLDRSGQKAMIVVGVLGLWLVLGRMVAISHSGFLLTASWSAIGLMAFAAGFVLRERTYRWVALGILTVALGRLFLFDVWQFDTFYRIVSFIALGAVLIALGFLYNRFADLLRRCV